jgi:TP901 family phage tail tape measure protein
MADLDTKIRIAILDSFTAPLRSLGLELTNVGAKARDASSRFQLASNLNQAAEGMQRFSSSVVASLRAPVEQFASLDEALARVSAKTGETRGSAGFEALKDQATSLGAATKYSAEQVALAQADMAASGRNVQEVLATIPSTLSFATAGSLDLARATEITNEVLNQFNLTAEQTAHVQDVLARADEVSSANVQGLGEALSYAGTNAARLNIPLETTSALLAALSDAGQKGSTGGTNLNAFLSSLVNPTKRAKDALQSMGLSLKQIKDLQVQVTTGNIVGAIDTLAAANARLDPRRSAEALDRIFGEQGGRAASVLFRSSRDGTEKGLDALIAKFQDVDGAVARTAKTMEDSLAGSLERARGAISGLTTQLGENMAPRVKWLAGLTEGAADGLRQLAIRFPDATTGGLQLVASLGAVSLGLKGALMTMSAYQGAVGASQGAVAALGGSLVGKFGLAGAALAAGLAVGTFIRDLLGTDDLLRPSNAPQALKPGEERDQTRGGVTMRDGLVEHIDPNLTTYGEHVDPKTGKRVRSRYWKKGLRGDVAIPRIVQEALAAGYQTKDEINEYIRNKRTMRAGLGQGPEPERVSLFPDPGTYDNVPAMKWPGGPREMVRGAAPAETDDIATKEQTAVLERTLRESMEVQQRTLEEIKRLGRGMPRAGGSGAGEGSF